MKNGFQVAKFLFEVQKTLNLFCLVQNGPVDIWVACQGQGCIVLRVLENVQSRVPLHLSAASILHPLPSQSSGRDVSVCQHLRLH